MPSSQAHGSITVDLARLRRFLVIHQGLDKARFHGGDGILEFIRQAGCIQYDPLNVVGRNHDLVLQARIRGYSAEWLDHLLYSTHRLFDGWDKNMSILPTEDWPCFQRQRQRARSRYDHPGRPAAAMFDDVRNMLRNAAPLCSADIASPRQVDWAWGPTRISRAALESLFFCGELVVARRKGTRRYYALAEQVMPVELVAAADPHPEDSTYDDWYVERRIRAAGAMWNRPGGAWLGITGFSSVRRQAAFARLERDGRILRLDVDGILHPLYICRSSLPSLEQAACGSVRGAAVLAPLDNLLWDRELVSAIFGFDYRWEVYKPEAERQYGYYVLPVLIGERLVARFEPERYRPGSPLHIRNWWWEPGYVPDTEAKALLQQALTDLCGFLGAEEISMQAGLKRKAGLGFLSSGRQRGS